MATLFCHNIHNTGLGITVFSIVATTDNLNLTYRIEIDACEPKYIEAMIRFIEELGPYIVIAPGLALPHARPEAGVKQTWFSLLTLKEPVEFGNEFNDPVYVVFCMAAKNKDEHIEALRQVATLCSEKEYFEKIKYAKNLTEIQDLLDSAGDL